MLSRALPWPAAVSVLRIYALAIGLFYAKLELRPYSIASRVLHCMRYALHNML